MAEKWDFLSAEYLAAVRVAFEARAEAVHQEIGDRPFTFAETYTGVPPHLGTDGTVAWHVTFVDGEAHFAFGEPAHADSQLRLDYTSTLPLARYIVGDDPARQAEFQRLIGEATAAGKFSVETGDRGRLAALDGFHDEAAHFTA